MTRDEAKKIFSAGFEHFITRNSLTQEAAGALFDCSKANVNKIKSGKSLPSIESLFSLVEAGMTLEEIFGAALAKKLMESMDSNNVEAPNEQDPTSYPNIFNSEAFKQGVLKVLSDEQILKFKMDQSSNKLIDNVK